jgi:PKD repeat protein
MSNRIPVVSVLLKKIFILNVILLLSVLQVVAKTIRLDADGGADQTTLQSACLKTVANAGDTVLIVGNDIDYYTETLNSTHQTNISIIGKSENPDSFPALILTWNDWWTTNSGKIYFKNVRLHNCQTIPLGRIPGKYLTAERCIFQLSGNNTFSIESSLEDSMLVLNNCIFYKLTGQIFPFISTLSTSPNGPYGIVNNCTFYGNNLINNDQMQYPTTDSIGRKFVLITNSIFYRSQTLKADTKITKYFNNCLIPTSENATDWGAGCVRNDNPLFVDTSYTYVGYGFQLRSNSGAINKAGTNSTPTDMGGRSRFSPDIGAWEYVAPPYNISLSASSLAENRPVNTTIGTIAVSDSNDAGPHTLTLGGTDGSAFTISGNNLVANQIFNYESDSSYSITIKATDRNDLSYQKTFSITITNVNDPPTGITLSKSTFPENATVGTAICTLKTTDEDNGATHTYSIGNGADSAKFSIAGSILKTAVVADYETKKSYIITLKTSDGTAEFQRLCTLFVTNVNEPHTGITLSNSGILEGKPIGTLVGRFSTVDIDVPPTPATFSFVSGTGSTDNGSFLIQGDSLLAAIVFNYGTKAVYSIRIRATDNSSNTFDKQFSINVGALPKITAEPVSKTVGVNKSTSFATTASGPGTLSYQWFRTGITSEQGTSPQLILANVPQALDKQTFYCIVSSSFGSDTSSLCTLTVIPMPVITSQPIDTHAVEKQTVSFNISVTGLNLSYRWILNGTDTLPGTSNTISLTNVSPSDSGDSIWCIVSNEAGSLRSSTARLHVLKLPNITTEPADQSVTEGDSAHFSVTVAGAAPLTYNWFRNSVQIGTSTPKLDLPPVSIADSNSKFFCIVSNSYGSDTSNIVTLKVLRTKPVIITQPRTLSLSENDTGFMYLYARGTPPLTYTWYKVGLVAPFHSSDTLLFENPSRALDSGSMYYCVVSNAYGSTKSDTVKLLVGMIKPQITIQPPETLTIYTGSDLSIPVAAIGTKPLSFTWKKIEDTTFSYLNQILNIGTVTISDSGRYFCIVKNDLGLAVSDTMLVKVANPPAIPIITKKPLNVEIAIGDSAIFTIDASGNPSPQYQWYWKGAPVSGATSKVLVLKGVSDTLSRISCIVYNNVDTVSSDTVSLKVIFQPTARFSAAPLTGPESTLVIFTNQTTGPAQSYIWSFGDNQTSTEQNPHHVYVKAGIYTVMLKATGNDSTKTDSIIKSDLISIYPRSGNPVKISAQYLSGRNVIITFSNLNDVDTSSPVPFADSMGLWTGPGKMPLLTSPPFLIYKKSIFTSQTGILKDTIPLPGQDTLVGLICGLYYNDKQLRGTDSINGTYVLLRDTITPPNPLTAQSTYLGGDSVRFNIFHISELDSSISDSVFIIYSPDSLLQSGQNVKKYRISDLSAQAGTGLFSTIIKNPLFATENAKFYFVLSVHGKNGKVTTTQLSSFYTAGSSTLNPISLQANLLSPSSVQLYWKNFSDPAVTDIRIFYSINEIPTGMIYPVFAMDTLKPRTSDTDFTVSALNSNTTYYFGAQVRKRNIDNTFTWSPITVQSLVKITTSSPLAEDSITNSIVILGEPSLNNNSQITLNWCLTDSAVTITDLEVGITFSTEQFPVLLYDPQIISVTESCTFSTLRMRQSILFDTTYYISLWLRKKNGPWAEPTESSRKFFRTPKFTRQTVALFEEGVDTFKINNSSILFWRDKARSYDNIIYDTVQAFNAISDLTGMVTAGQGIEFIKHQTPIPFFIGLRYSCAPPFSEQDVRLYRYVNGSLYVIPDCKIDALNKIIYIYTRDINDPILPLIDTLPPVISILSDTVSAWDPNVPYIDSIHISDNIVNPQVIHFYCKGDTVIEEARVDKSVLLNGSSTLLDIPASVITTTAGVRARIEVSDGRNTQSVNTSRRVYRAQSDEGVASKLKWRPLYVTAELENKAPQQLFPQFMKKVTDSSYYNNHRLLLFRWQPTDNNKSRQDYKWVEYSDSTASYFTFDPGVLIWLKTSDQHAYHFGPGTTLSLKDTFEITLPPREWTDMGLPFKFSTSINQILATSPGADNLHYYEWVTDSAGSYRTSLMYAKGLPAPTMLMTKDSSFTIYNSTASAVTIRIPPIPAQFATQPAVQKAKAKKDWWIKLKTHLSDNTTLPDIYCGFSAERTQPYRYPSSPVFGLSKVKLYDREDNSAYGHFVNAITSEGIAKEVVFENMADTQVTFFYALEKVGNAPDGYTASLYSPTTTKWQATGSITVGAQSCEYRWFVTGTADFITVFQNKAAAFKFRLYPIYPNPARAFAAIRYSIPLSAREKLNFTIYDAMGRLVWRKLITEPLDAGEHKLIWNGTNLAGQKITSGMYIVVFSVLDQKGSVKYKFDSRLTYFQ